MLFLNNFCEMKTIQRRLAKMNPPMPIAILAMPMAHVFLSQPHGSASDCTIPSLNVFCSSMV